MRIGIMLFFFHPSTRLEKFLEHYLEQVRITEDAS